MLTALMLSISAQADDLKTEMQRLQQQHDISFVYDASLDLSADYKGSQLSTLPLSEALDRLFARTFITYRIDGHHVLLRQRQALRHTLSGYVTDEHGEPLINATILDLTSGHGTTTNEHGFFSLTLPEGLHRLRFSYIGYAQRIEEMTLTTNRSLTVSLAATTPQLMGITVDGDLNSPVLTTQTGRRTLTPHELKPEFALLSTPDVIKTLQMQSGVAQGVELLSGLYVHGGGGDENLFLLDGTPLYQTNHLLGLFSAFNADVVKNVDFYKSGFPARYGGRLSSVVDVRTADGDMQRWRGLYALGLIDGRFQIEGPIRRNRTSLNIGLRRTWADLVLRPIMAIYNHKNPEDQLTLGYFFHDLNAKLTHRPDSFNTLQLSFYSGNDRFSLRNDYDENFFIGSDTETHWHDAEHVRGVYSWGNDNVSADWKHIFSPRLYGYLSATYSHNRAKYHYRDDDRTYIDDELHDVLHNEHRYQSTIDDLSLRTDLDFRPQPKHHVRFGGAYSYHLFRPQTRSAVAFFGSAESEGIDTLRTESRNRQRAHEVNVYAEDEVQLSSRWSANAGVHAELFGVSGRTFFTVDPRLATKVQLSRTVSLKASYTWMTQQMHRLQNTYIDLPTDYWVPTTRNVPPMRSVQWSAGLYARPSRQWLVVVEAYLKRSSHLLQYGNWIGLEPPADAWDTVVEQGDGRAHGIDVDVVYSTSRLELSAAYTLSKTERRFAEHYDGWFPDKFDNRHKLNLMARLRFRRSDFYAAWTFHTGNRITLPEHFVALPKLPDGSLGQYYTSDGQFVYATPNNATLPAYHRLDLGWNLRHTTKAGHERIWNISVYNAYSRQNPLYAEVRQTNDDRFKVVSVGFVPVIPSVSYTIKF